MQNPLRNATLAAAALAALGTLTSTAHAQQRVWDGGGSTDNWSEDANWNNSFSGTVGAVWRLGTPGATQLATDMDLDYNLERLEFFNTSPWSVNSSTGSTLSLRGAGNQQTVLVGSGAADVVDATFNVPIVLAERSAGGGGNLPGGDNSFKLFDVRPGSTLTFNNPITSGIYDIRKAGPGDVTFNAASPNLANEYQIANGTTFLGDDDALGSATVVKQGGFNLRFDTADGTARTLDNDFVHSGFGAFSFGAVSGTDTVLNGDITLADGLVNTFGGGDSVTVTVNGSIGGNGGFSKATGATFVLNGDNTFDGGINAGNNGTLFLNGDNSASDAQTTGGGTLNGTGSVRTLSVFGDTTVDPVARGTFSPDDNFAAGVFTAANAVFGDGGTYVFNIDDAAGAPGVGHDLLTLDGSGGVGAATLDVTATDGGFLIDVAGGNNFNANSNQAFTLVDADGVLNFDPTAFTVDASDFDADLMGGMFSVGVDGGDLVLNFMAAMQRLAGDANGDGSVTIADFAILRANFGTSGSSFEMGDFNEDGSVTIADFAILRANFGTTVSSAELAEADAWAASVPEPAALGLLAAAGLSLVRRRA